MFHVAESEPARAAPSMLPRVLIMGRVGETSAIRLDLNVFFGFALHTNTSSISTSVQSKPTFTLVR